MLLISGHSFGQTILHDYKKKTDSLNNVYFKKLKNFGQFDSEGQKTGFWVQYELVVDSASSSIPATIQGLDFSVNIELPNPSRLRKSEGNFASGQMTNLWKWFEASYYNDSITWQVTRETVYLNGKKNGLDKEYSFGNIYHDAKYSNDKITGTETYYLSQDIKYIKIQWKNGVAKKANWYYENGKIKTTKDYRKFPLTKVAGYHENGKVKAKYTVLGEDEVFDGEYLAFDEDGKMIEKRRYSNGVETKK